jgi:hypothetical protein
VVVVVFARSFLPQSGRDIAVGIEASLLWCACQVCRMACACSCGVCCLASSVSRRLCTHVLHHLIWVFVVCCLSLSMVVGFLHSLLLFIDAGGLIRNLIDWTGQPTTWGRWSPTDINDGMYYSDGASCWCLASLCVVLVTGWPSLMHAVAWSGLHGTRL